jgi:hypothetical protein
MPFQKYSPHFSPEELRALTAAYEATVILSNRASCSVRSMLCEKLQLRKLPRRGQRSGAESGLILINRA